MLEVAVLETADDGLNRTCLIVGERKLFAWADQLVDEGDALGVTIDASENFFGFESRLYQRFFRRMPPEGDAISLLSTSTLTPWLQ